MSTDRSSADETIDEPSLPFNILRTYGEQHTKGGFAIVIAQGSVLDFSHVHGAIVNAANEGCLGGGGVDGAITSAGGENLAADREALPVLQEIVQKASRMASFKNENQGANEYSVVEERTHIRCFTGSAVLTGPGHYGRLKVPYVIHAVGPNFWVHSPKDGHGMLISAYQTSLDLAAKTDRVTDVAFSLLSAGVFRGRIKLNLILSASIKAIRDWKSNGLGKIRRVYLFGFNDRECAFLVRAGDRLLTEMDVKTTPS